MAVRNLLESGESMGELEQNPKKEEAFLKIGPLCLSTIGSIMCMRLQENNETKKRGGKV
ncbi:hypothetical protein [Paenibacillus fonticola]|uniref:hypothetical protein n=1 Tax=Paenibacillus fonticola TaxID=379896 RepID=UPI000364C370|nr:hypothetical protein [Paenibacillus fonticola]